MSQVDIEAAKRSLADSLRLMKEGVNEQVIRDSFTSHLRQIFPQAPNWVLRHIHGSEAAVKVIKAGINRTGFVDNLVDLTAIEYESDLTIGPKYAAGLVQVKDYCSGLINRGSDPELIIGILSDTVRWYAWSIDSGGVPPGLSSRDNIILHQIDFIDCSAASQKSAADLTRFLIKYLGREGARIVTADAIAKDLGFDSLFCQQHLDSITGILTAAFSGNPKYAQLISDLWRGFVSYLREEGRADEFDLKTYVDEYYIVTLGKLICANYLEQKALSSDESELLAIADGRFFENKGLLNFVEYDYFGWLNSAPYIKEILPIASAMQQDLIAYNFISPPSDDLFGKLMAQLANRSQRLLLGQEWTPGWLSRKLVGQVVDQLGPDEPMRLIDMCCGSGSMIIEAMAISKQRILSAAEPVTKERQIDMLVQTITGFDIDPLAVMLSKINWVLAAKDWIQPFGTYPLSIPIYHADSLFAITPVTNIIKDKDRHIYTLKMAEYSIRLPEYLISPRFSSVFDELSQVAYKLVVSAGDEDRLHLSRADMHDSLETIIASVATELDENQVDNVCSFFYELVQKIDALNRDGRNGIWGYILRNSFRPGLVAGQFNGLVANPPWLALSKVADNPYQEILKKMAADLNIKPAGSSHLHIELATIFLLYAIRYYLAEGASIGCIVPDTVLNGSHHNAFRKAQYFTSKMRVAFDVKEIWKLGEDVFKNNGIVLFGDKSRPDQKSDKPIPGKIIFEREADINTVFYRNRQGNRTAWFEREQEDKGAGLYKPAKFRQGADIMPRNVFFYETYPSGQSLFDTRSIDRVTSNIAYIVKDAKKHADFYVSPRLLPKDLFFDVITSNLLTSFDLAPVQKALLPIRKNDKDVWQTLSPAEVVAKGASAFNTFNEMWNVADPGKPAIKSLFDILNVRGKLIQQIILPGGYLVVSGAGGGKVCAAYMDLKDYDAQRLVIDQTVYWAQVQSEDEAIYLTGLLNSDAIREGIRGFQPRGLKGPRHIHKLPFGTTPPYDPKLAAHQVVVERTRELIQEYRHLISGTAGMMRLLNPNSGVLPGRRKKLVNHIRQLAAYRAYEEACGLVFER